VEFRQSVSGRVSQPISPPQIADLRLAATQTSGAKRRVFQAERAEQYCGGTIHAKLSGGAGGVARQAKLDWPSGARALPVWGGKRPSVGGGVGKTNIRRRL
jgi:hypothetical protein